MSAAATFARVSAAGLVAQEHDWAHLSDYERGLLRTIGYRDVLPVDDLQQHNTDLSASQWTPTEVRAGATPLPVYPAPADLPGLPA